MRDILFEIFSRTEIRERFDKSDEFWKRFNVQDPKDQKVLGLYEVEHINDPCYVTLSVNPKNISNVSRVNQSVKSTKELKKFLLAWTTKITPKELNLCSILKHSENQN